MKQKRDLWWSGFFPKASNSCKPEVVPSDSITLLLPTRYLIQRIVNIVTLLMDNVTIGNYILLLPTDFVTHF